MSDEGFKYQANLKAGNDLLNIRADAADEFIERIESLFGEGSGVQVLSRFFGGVTATQAQAVVDRVVQPVSPGAGDASPQTCPQCGVGQVVTKNRKDGKGTFQGCNNYPNCNYIKRGA